MYTYIKRFIKCQWIGIFLLMVSREKKTNFFFLSPPTILITFLNAQTRLKHLNIFFWRINLIILQLLYQKLHQQLFFLMISEINVSIIDFFLNITKKVFRNIYTKIYAKMIIEWAFPISWWNVCLSLYYIWKLIIHPTVSLICYWNQQSVYRGEKK